MSYRTGTADNLYDLLDVIVDTAALDGWTIVETSNATFNGVTRRNSVVLHGIGDGNDNIYVNMIVDPDEPRQMILDMSAGYDSDLYYWEQPGSIQQWNKTYEDKDTGKPLYQLRGKSIAIPAFNLVVNEQFTYFIFTNSYRIIVVCRLSIDYQSFYIGLLAPISSEKQFPYPAYVAGNNSVSKEIYNEETDETTFVGSFYPDVPTSSFVFPAANTGWLRRADGTWRSFYMPYSANIGIRSFSEGSNSNNGITGYYDGYMFPYICNNKSLVPNYVQNSVENIDFLLIPVIAMTSDPVDMCGLLRNVYWISGTRDVASEQIVVLDDKQYIVFDDGNLRDNNSYFCIEIEN